MRQRSILEFGIKKSPPSKNTPRETTRSPIRSNDIDENDKEQLRHIPEEPEEGRDK